MINRYEVYETNQMIAEENLDVRTITLGTVSYTHLTLPTTSRV